MKEAVNDMPSNMTSINFDLIKGWISEHLKMPNNIVHSVGRNVIVNTETGPKEFTIPKLTETNKEQWQKAWIDVYEACLKTLQLKVNNIYVTGKKEGYIVQISPNEVRVGITIIKIVDDYGSVAYTRALEKIISTYDKIKKEEARMASESSLNVNRSTIKIDSPNKAVANMYTVGDSEITPKLKDKTVITPVPNVSKPISDRVTKSISANDEHTVKAVRMSMPKAVGEENRPRVETPKKRQVTIQKIPGNISLDKTDCEIYREQPLVIVTCMSVKNGDGVFRDNIEMLRDNIPNISIGSFISGKSSNIEQALKEKTRIIKLLGECKVSKLVIYEINNDYINNHLKKKESIAQIMNAANDICKSLIEANYYPILCMDFDTYENVKKVVPEYQENYPIIKCVTPKQKDMVSAKDNILYMNPSSDSDAVMVSDLNMQTKLDTMPKNAIRESYSGVAA